MSIQLNYAWVAYVHSHILFPPVPVTTKTDLPLWVSLRPQSPHYKCGPLLRCYLDIVVGDVPSDTLSRENDFCATTGHQRTPRDQILHHPSKCVSGFF